MMKKSATDMTIKETTTASIQQFVESNATTCR
jgi:hypothetical protein